MGDYIYLLLNNAGLFPTVELVGIGFMVLILGGMLQFEYMIGSGIPFLQIYLVLLGIAAVFYFVVSTQTVKDKILWQRKIQPAKIM